MTLLFQIEGINHNLKCHECTTEHVKKVSESMKYKINGMEKYKPFIPISFLRRELSTLYTSIPPLRPAPWHQPFDFRDSKKRDDVSHAVKIHASHYNFLFHMYFQWNEFQHSGYLRSCNPF